MGLAADKQESFGTARINQPLFTVCLWVGHSRIPAFHTLDEPSFVALSDHHYRGDLSTGRWFAMFQIIRKQVLPSRQRIIKPARIILTLSFLALTIKFMLQSGSVIPSLSTLAFGFRPIVIGYLHLVLLGFTTLFLLGSMLEDQ